MSTAPHTSLRIRALLRPRMLHALVGLSACAALVATYSVAALTGAPDTSTRPARAAATRSTPRASLPAAVAETYEPVVISASARAPEAPPSAAEFGKRLFAMANAYAAQQGQAVRLGRADCVQAAPGRYMCSYASRTPGQAAECHLLQARWTPEAASTFTVTLSGRVARCDSLRAALRSLR